jgi:hypothetical protein
VGGIGRVRKTCQIQQLELRFWVKQSRGSIGFGRLDWHFTDARKARRRLPSAAAMLNTAQNTTSRPNERAMLKATNQEGK